MAGFGKQYVYKVYRAGNLIGPLDNVVSDFSYRYKANTPGTELQIILQANFGSVGAVLAEDLWTVDEAGEHVIDENSTNIAVSLTNTYNNIPLDLGNEVRVYMYSDRYKTGLLVFAGLISAFEASHLNDTIKITVLSWGVQLDNFLALVNPTANSVSQTVYESEYTLTAGGDSTGAIQTKLAQSFNLGSDTDISGFSVILRQASNSSPIGQAAMFFGWQIYAGTPVSPGALVVSNSLFYTDRDISTKTYNITFPSQTFVAGNYYLVLYNSVFPFSGNVAPIIQYTNTNPYAGGQLYQTTNGGATWSAIAGSDMAFSVFTTPGQIAISYANAETSVIIEAFLNQLLSQGGVIAWNSSSIQSTSAIVNYRYKTATILDGINKAIELTPSNFGWYIDLATKIFYLLAKSDTADHTMVLGTHLVDLNIIYSLENVANLIVFSGGDDGSGSNVYLTSSSSPSIAMFGQWLKKIADNRVNNSTDGSVLADSLLGQSENATYEVQYIINDNDYDTELFNMLDTVGFANFNNLIDSLVLQIVVIERAGDQVTLTLGVIPPAASSTYEDTRRRLDAQESENNPT